MEIIKLGVEIFVMKQWAVENSRRKTQAGIELNKNRIGKG